MKRLMCAVLLLAATTVGCETKVEESKSYIIRYGDSDKNTVNLEIGPFKTEGECNDAVFKLKAGGKSGSITMTCVKE